MLQIVRTPVRNFYAKIFRTTFRITSQKFPKISQKVPTLLKGGQCTRIFNFLVPTSQQSVLHENILHSIVCSFCFNHLCYSIWKIFSQFQIDLYESLMASHHSEGLCRFSSGRVPYNSGRSLTSSPVFVLNSILQFSENSLGLSRILLNICDCFWIFYCKPIHWTVGCSFNDIQSTNLVFFIDFIAKKYDTDPIFCLCFSWFSTCRPGRRLRCS